MLHNREKSGNVQVMRPQTANINGLIGLLIEFAGMYRIYAIIALSIIHRTHR